jgi:hypothetical protein
MYYDFDGKEITMEQWGDIQRSPERHVADTTFGGYRISTIHVGKDMGIYGNMAPLIYETMIFNDNHDQYHLWKQRYFSRAQAIKGHEYAVQMIQGNIKTINNNVKTETPE